MRRLVTLHKIGFIFISIFMYFYYWHHLSIYIIDKNNSDIFIIFVYIYYWLLLRFDGAATFVASRIPHSNPYMAFFSRCLKIFGPSPKNPAIGMSNNLTEHMFECRTFSRYLLPHIISKSNYLSNKIKILWAHEKIQGIDFWQANVGQFAILFYWQKFLRDRFFLCWLRSRYSQWAPRLTFYK